MAWVVLNPHTRNVLRIDNSAAPPANVSYEQVEGTLAWPTRPYTGAVLRLRDGALVWEDDRALPEFKAAKWADIKRRREAAETAGFTWDGSVFDSDVVSQGRIQGAVLLAMLATQAGQPFEIEWTLADNSTRTLDAAQMIAAGNALGVHVQTQHAIARALRVTLDAATTGTAAAAVSWPG